MHYLIDGYNLLHHVGLLLGRVPPGRLEKARALLLNHLRQHRDNDPSVAITVVFDARQSARKQNSAQSEGGIQVYFTFSGEADDLIEEMLRGVAIPQQMTVVSNDRRLQEAARRRRCGVMECISYWETAARVPVPSPAPQKDESKPETLSQEEVRQWEKAFADLQLTQDLEEWQDMPPAEWDLED